MVISTFLVSKTTLFANFFCKYSILYLGCKFSEIFKNIYLFWPSFFWILSVIHSLSLKDRAFWLTFVKGTCFLTHLESWSWKKVKSALTSWLESLSLSQFKLEKCMIDTIFHLKTGIIVLIKCSVFVSNMIFYFTIKNCATRAAIWLIILPLMVSKFVTFENILSCNYTKEWETIELIKWFVLVCPS